MIKIQIHENWTPFEADTDLNVYRSFTIGYPQQEGQVKIPRAEDLHFIEIRKETKSSTHKEFIFYKPVDPQEAMTSWFCERTIEGIEVSVVQNCTIAIEDLNDISSEVICY